MNQELSIKLIKELEKAPRQTQRALSQSCGESRFHSLLLNALVKKGYVKAKNFKNAQNKMAYAYILTPAGINLKRIDAGFLSQKQIEYAALQKEIAELEKDLGR